MFEVSKAESEHYILGAVLIPDKVDGDQDGGCGILGSGARTFHYVSVRKTNIDRKEPMAKEADTKADQEPNPAPMLMDVTELGRELGISSWGVRGMLKRGQIPARCIRKIGSRIRFDRAEVKAWVDSCKLESA